LCEQDLRSDSSVEPFGNATRSGAVPSPMAVLARLAAVPNDEVEWSASPEETTTSVTERRGLPIQATAASGARDSESPLHSGEESPSSLAPSADVRLGNRHLIDSNWRVVLTALTFQREKLARDLAVRLRTETQQQQAWDSRSRSLLQQRLEQQAAIER